MKKILTSFVACLVLGLAFGQNSNGPCTGLTVDFTHLVDPATGGIFFTNTSESTTSTTLTYLWEFGNNKSSSEKDPHNMYDEGTYQVALTVTDDTGCATTHQKEVVFSYGGQ